MSTDATTGTRAPAAAAPELSRSGARVRWDAFVRRFPRAPAMLVLAVLVLTLNGFVVHRSSSVSPIDETGWINQLVKGSRFEVVTPGELMPQETLGELCIRGSQLFAWPPCPRGHIDGRDYVFKGVDISVHSPFYFLISGPIAGALQATPVDLPPDDSLVTWGRLLGSAWLLLGLYLTLRAGELLAVRRRAVMLALGFLIATPALLHASTIVNPDQTALPSGAAVLLAGLSWERRGRGLWVVALVALVGAALDPTNAIAMLLVITYLGVRAIQRWRNAAEDTTPKLAASAAAVALMVFAVYLATKGWDQVHAWLREGGVITPGSRLRDITYNPVQEVVTQVRPTIGRAFGFETPLSMFPPFESWIPPVMQTAAYTAFAGIAKIVAIGALGVTVLGARLRGRIAALGVATTVTLLVSPTLIVLRDWYETTHYLQPDARYGLGAVPALAILIAVATERARSAQLVVGLSGAALYGSALVAVVF